MDRIELSEVELLEMNRCFHCDCSTYPICTWIGEPCKECFNTDSFTHYNPDVRPGLFQTRNTVNTEKRIIKNTKVSEIKTSNDGDCLYDCFARALNRYLRKGIANKEITIADMRMFVSRYQTPDMYNAYKTLAESSSDYECIAKTHSLRSFKNIIQQCGNNVGAEKCLWGDENTLNIFSEIYRIRVVVFNERGQLLQIIGTDELRHTILLRLNQQQKAEEHYTLMQFNNQTILQKHEWIWLKKYLHIQT